MVIARVCVRLDDAAGNKDNKQQGHQRPFRDQEDSAGPGLHVRHIVASEEEGNVGRDEYGNDTPPRINPNEGMVARSGEEGFE